jgi:hypothetical protein
VAPYAGLRGIWLQGLCDGGLNGPRCPRQPDERSKCGSSIILVRLRVLYVEDHCPAYVRYCFEEPMDAADLPVALRAAKRAVQARGLTSDNPFREETDDPLVADRRNFFKVELRTKDGQHVDRLLFAGNSLDKARARFAAHGKRRPRARLTIRQRSRLEEWPP